MDRNEHLLTVAFVLVIGLIGGYMLGEHAGHAEAGHEAALDHHSH